MRTLVAPVIVCGMLTACHRPPVQIGATVPASGDVARNRPVPSGAAAIARARADSLRYPYTAADIHFMSGMIGHHSQAIVMARMAPSHGASAEVRTLAARIINSQQDEIAIMQRWLGDRQQPVPLVTDGMAPGMMHGGTGAMEMPGMDMPGAPMTAMPGMLTAAQMATLGASRNEAWDENFLTFMMQHHRGALSMVKDLFATDGAGQDETIFKFASDVNVDQTTEIARMERMLFMLKLGKK